MEEKFIIIGQKMDMLSMKMVGVTITIDFAKFQPRKCSGNEEPDT